MSESVKEAVRARDGMKCRDCGMTEDQHFERYGKTLDVHRVIPGITYAPQFCVTLCRACHGKKPKTMNAAYFGEPACGVVFFDLILYDDEQRLLWNQMADEANARGLFKEELLVQILRERYHGGPLYYSI